MKFHIAVGRELVGWLRPAGSIRLLEVSGKEAGIAADTPVLVVLPLAMAWTIEITRAVRAGLTAILVQ